MPAQTCGIEGNECNEVMELKKTLHEDSIQSPKGADAGPKVVGSCHPLAAQVLMIQVFIMDLPTPKTSHHPALSRRTGRAGKGKVGFGMATSCGKWTFDSQE